MDFNPTHVTVTTNDNTIIMVWTVAPQVAAGSVNNNWRGHVGLHWAEIQLSVNLTGVLDDFFHVAIKSRMLVLSTSVTICVDAQVPLFTLFLLETKLFLLTVNILVILARPQRQTNVKGCWIFGDLDQLKSKDTMQKTVNWSPRRREEKK